MCRVDRLLRQEQCDLEMQFLTKKIRISRPHASCGKGSRSTLYFGDDKTTIKDLRKEIGPGLLSAMLEQLNEKLVVFLAN